MEVQKTKLSQSDVEAVIRSEFYFTAGDGVRGESELGTSPAGSAEHLNRLTFCILVLRNGFTITGQSACVDYRNYDKQKGRDAARENAVKQIWELEAYLLRQKLHEANS